MSPVAGIPLHCTACTQARGAGVWDRSQTPSSLHSALSPVRTVVHQTLLVQCNAGGGRVPAQLAWLITRPAPLCLCRAIIAAHNLQLLPDYASHNEHWTLNSKWIVQTAQEFRSVKRVVLYRGIIRPRLRSGVSGSQIVWYGGCEVQQPLLTCAGTSLQQLSTFVCRCFSNWLKVCHALWGCFNRDALTVQFWPQCCWGVLSNVHREQFPVKYSAACPPLPPSAPHPQLLLRDDHWAPLGG